MKIGILTFHRAINYGAVLQCYGLKETLKALGHDVEIIDYRPECIERYRRIVPFYEIRHTPELINKIKIFLSSIFSAFLTINANKRFDDFLNNHFSFSKIVHTPCNLPQKYDVIIFGSDQIWSPQICFGFDSIYWGQFPHNTTRLITYAASIGGHNKLKDEEWDILGSFLTSFEKISVREKQLQLDLKQKLGIDSHLDVDPTILANSFIFDNIATCPKNIPQNYVLIFSVAHTENLTDIAKLVARQTNSEIITLKAKRTFSFSKKDIEESIYIYPTIEEFLGLFKYAKCVITVSFHGTVFSVLFRKNFYSLQNHMQDRAQHFLDEIGLSYRMIPTDKESIRNFHFEPINYNKVEDKINSLKQSSLNYIHSIIE